MKKHNWEIASSSAGVVGSYDYWVCHNCGCLGGVLFPENYEDKEPFRKPYLAGTPLVDLSDDCEEAVKTIDSFVEKYPVWQEYVDRERRAGQGNRTPIVGLEGPGTANIPDPQDGLKGPFLGDDHG